MHRRARRSTQSLDARILYVMEPFPPEATEILGPIWFALGLGGFAFFGLCHDGKLKRRMWPLYMAAIWLFIVPMIVWFRIPIALALFALVGWGVVVYFNYRAWYFCTKCGASSLVAFSSGPKDACPKCQAIHPAGV